MSTALLWLTRDLRCSDNPALAAALDAAEEIVPVFCLDRRLLQGRNRSAARTRFMIECLGELRRSLRQRGGELVLRDGPPERELPRLARELRASAVHASADVGPFATAREERVRAALEQVNAHLHLHPGLFVVDDPAAIRTREGRPQTIFTPYYRAWLRASRRAALCAPTSIAPLPRGVAPGRVPGLKELGFGDPPASALAGGERAGREQLERFLGGGIEDYAKGRDLLRAGASSMLSPYLHFGCLSAREIESLLPDHEDGQELRRRLCWRDFFAQVLRSFPGNARSEYRVRYRGALRFSRSRRAFRAWCEGRTGYPVVDAAMRQLRDTGWMPNRARLIVGSFLTKDLGLDWRWGERWFMSLLIDGDVASNNGNWQWVASVGVDPQPPARRIFNPTLQQRRFDPDGSYVRQYLPELANVPDRYIAEPWLMPRELQEQIGCLIGRDYPAPIVDHAQARREALARYARAS
jgi:deoxyribodipyrimidine photo-lyase